MVNTDWTPPSKNTTDWTNPSKNSTDWGDSSKTRTEWLSGIITSNSILLMQNSDSFQLQDGTNFLGLQIDT